jgi:hypothetical protein
VHQLPAESPWAGQSPRVPYVEIQQRPDSAERRRLPHSDLDEIRRKKLGTEYELVTKLMSQAEHDNETEVLSNLAAYKARLEQEMGGDSAGRANPT